VGDVSHGRSNASSGRREEAEYQKYRARYEQLREDLLRRDRQAQTDPFLLQRWPLERKVFADRVQQALTEWEVFGHKSDVEARGSTIRQKAGPDEGPVEDESGVEKPPAPENY
jgi:hypothetical protein